MKTYAASRCLSLCCRAHSNSPRSPSFAPRAPEQRSRCPRLPLSRQQAGRRAHHSPAAAAAVAAAAHPAAWRLPLGTRSSAARALAMPPRCERRRGVPWQLLQCTAGQPPLQRHAILTRPCPPALPNRLAATRPQLELHPRPRVDQGGGSDSEVVPHEARRGPLDPDPGDWAAPRRAALRWLAGVV